jgi:hypothetical protein
MNKTLSDTSLFYFFNSFLIPKKINTGSMSVKKTPKKLPMKTGIENPPLVIFEVDTPPTTTEIKETIITTVFIRLFIKYKVFTNFQKY